MEDLWEPVSKFPYLVDEMPLKAVQISWGGFPPVWPGGLLTPLSLSPWQFEKHVLSCCFNLLAKMERNEMQNPVFVSRALCTMVCGEEGLCGQTPGGLYSKGYCGPPTAAQQI